MQYILDDFTEMLQGERLLLTRIPNWDNNSWYSNLGTGTLWLKQQWYWAVVNTWHTDHNRSPKNHLTEKDHTWVSSDVWALWFVLCWFSLLSYLVCQGIINKQIIQRHIVRINAVSLYFLILHCIIWHWISLIILFHNFFCFAWSCYFVFILINISNNTCSF